MVCYATRYRLDRNASGVEILSHKREYIPLTFLISKLSIEGFFIEIRLRKKKWFLCCYYDPKKNLMANHLNCIGRSLGSELKQYENFIFMGHFNVDQMNVTMTILKYCRNIVEDKTCFKNSIDQTCIDLIITNRSKPSEIYVVVETGLSVFHKMSLTVTKLFYNKKNPRKSFNIKTKKISSEAFTVHGAMLCQISYGAFKTTMECT